MNTNLLFIDLSKFVIWHDYCLLIIVVSWIAMLIPYPTVVSSNAMIPRHPNTYANALNCRSIQIVSFQHTRIGIAVLDGYSCYLMTSNGS